MSWCWRRSGSPATKPSGPVTKLDPLDHLQPIPAAHWTHGAGGNKRFFMFFITGHKNEFFSGVQ
jgi:hypothetical protein